nr:RNA polymerase sigma-70 factor [Streptoalloteichus tenebrarius]
MAVFEEHRPRLLGLAYRLLGSASEAEDVVQEAFLRWDAAERDLVASPAAWLTKVVANLCLNQLASARARRESYVGPWLPEPVLTEDGALGPLETVERRESVSFGLLVLLERLTPPERAVFVLREAFGHSHREIAEILDVEEAHSRQLLRRARQRVGESRARYSVDSGHHRRVVERFLAATLHGDVAELERLLADEVGSWADGGGAVTAARRPVLGRDRVLRYLLGMGQRPEAAHLTATIAEVNGEPAALLRFGGVLAAVVTVETDDDGRVTAVRSVFNPEKLAYLTKQLV